MRHIKRHYGIAMGTQWICYGLTVEQAVSCGVPDRLLREADWCEDMRSLMVGGCGQSFSRKSGYTRHLKNDHIGCWAIVDGRLFRGD